MKKLNKKQLGSRIGEKARSLDMFGRALPLNIAGSLTVTSLPGFSLTVLLLCIMIAYFATRLQVLVFKLNPQVTQSTIMNNFDTSYVINTKDHGFMFAWGIETTYNPQPKLDSNYV
jgi:hypothetical protein